MIKDDLSNWLNGKDIDVFVTSTPGEHESIAGDGTAYRYTSREAQITGLPRFDKIRAEGKKFPPAKRGLILVAPTWRQWLILHTPSDKAARTVDSDEFSQSDYAAAVDGVPHLHRTQGTRRPHRARRSPAAAPQPADRAAVAGSAALHREARLRGQNVQEIFASARVVVTDYSSMAFNAAYIDRPLVYFQFDPDTMFGGGHVGRQGYFEYERDGFGPVVTRPRTPWPR